MHSVHTREPNLSAIDLNLLVTLEALLVESSVSKAAARIGRSQSAVSHALERLRALFHDPLLRREGYGMRATPRGEALRAPLSNALDHLRSIVGETDGFDPGRSTRDFVVATPDLFAPLLGPLVATLRDRAPGLSVTLGPPTSPDALVRGAAHLELAVGNEPPGKGIERVPFGRFDWAVFARKGHRVRKRPSVEEWARWPHIQVAGESRSPGPVSRAAARAGCDRHVAVRVASFVAALAMVADSNLLFTTLRQPFSTAARQLGLRQLECPLDLPEVDVGLSMRDAADPGVRWLRDRTLETCRQSSTRSPASVRKGPRRNGDRPQGGVPSPARRRSSEGTRE